MGSFFNVPFYRLQSNGQIENTFRDFKTRFPNMKIIGTTAHENSENSKTGTVPPLWEIDLTVPVLFLMGNETDGLNRRLAGICDTLATLPMSGTSSASSLNVSCAATAMMYEAVRQREEIRKEDQKNINHAIL